MERPPYRHVIWDWNGTLLNDAWLCVDCMNRLLRRRGLEELTVERYQETFDFPVVEYYRRLGFDFTRETFEAAGTEFIAEYERRKTECELQPHARETVAALRAAGLTQSVLSAYRQDTLERFVTHFGLRDSFLRLVGLQDHYAAGKVDLGRRWIAELPNDPSEVLMVGDTTHDAETARAMGVDCVLVPGGHNTPERLAACGVPVLGSLRDLSLLLHS